MATKKLCGKCKAEIPADALKCMHCSSKQGMGLVSGFFAVLFTIIVFSMVAISVSTPNSSSGPSPSPSMPQYRPAASICMDALRGHAKFPSSVSFSIFSSPPVTLQQNDGSTLVRVAYTAKNSYGNKLPLAGHCTVKNNQVISVESDPR